MNKNTAAKLSIFVVVMLTAIGVSHAQPDNITSLDVLHKRTNTLTWDWTDPTSDYNHTEVRVTDEYGNWHYKTNTSNGHYRYDELLSAQSYEIAVRPLDEWGNRGEWTNNTATTLGDDTMASFGIIAFVTTLSFAVLFLPRLWGRFSRNETLNTALKGICVATGLFLLALSTAVVATVADTYGIPVTSELFLWLWLLQKAAWLATFVAVLKYGMDVLRLWRMDKEKKQYGYDEA